LDPKHDLIDEHITVTNIAKIFGNVKTFKSNNPMLTEETHVERYRDPLLEEICAILPTMS
jgi:hypothetical protein